MSSCPLQVWASAWVQGRRGAVRHPVSEPRRSSSLVFVRLGDFAPATARSPAVDRPDADQDERCAEERPSPGSAVATVPYTDEEQEP